MRRAWPAALAALLLAPPPALAAPPGPSLRDVVVVYRSRNHLQLFG